MPGLLLIFAFQATAAAPAQKTDAPERFSILVPVGNERCARRPGDSDATVCGNPLPSQTLPYPNEVVPNGPVPSNPYRTGVGALAAESTPCAVAAQGCIVGFGPPILPIVKGAAGLIGSAFRKKPDKTGRVPIPLDDSAPPPIRLEP